MENIYTKKPVCFFILLLFSFCANAQDNAALLNLVKQNAAHLRIAQADADAAVISSSFRDEKTGIEYVYLQQTHQGLKVFNNILSIAFQNGKLLYSSGRFVSDMPGRSGTVQTAVPPPLAVSKAATHLQRQAFPELLEDKFATEKKYVFSPSAIAKRAIEVELMWAMDDEEKNVHLVWNVNVDLLQSADWWNVRIDARTGAVVNKDNWTVHENEAPSTGVSRHFRSATPAAASGNAFKSASPFAVTDAAYNVIPYPNESPYTSGPVVESNPWLKAGVANSATTLGWHYDGTAYHDSTRSNNVHAYLDAANRNTPAPPNFSAVSNTPQPSLDFNFPATFTQQPAVRDNRLFAITNLFYWNNVIHDITYQYGFTEAAGNFQFFNNDRGGAGNDYVRAEAQDGLGVNNANFSTPADGSSGRMQMYLWTVPADLTVTGPEAVVGKYRAPESNFSTANKLKNVGAVSGQVVWYDDNAAGTTHFACAAPVNPVTGKIAMILRGGTCASSYILKVKNAQNAGALAVIMVNDVAGAAVVMGGTDNTITIPAVMISQADGALLAAQIPNNLTVTLAAGIELDGDVDNGIIVHEYGHGISNRLTGGRLNASCLSNAEQGGEGWSDYLALMLTTNWATAQVTDGPKPRPMGVYALGQPLTGSGIRLYPYSTNMTVNPLTYANMPSVAVPHGIGTIWATTLWDMTWNIIQQENAINPNLYDATGTGGNVVAMRLVMEGMRLQPCRPGFLDARDAILSADSILYNGVHRCAIWNAFARRGMGLSASQGSNASTTDQTVAFDVPSAVSLTKSVVPVKVNNGAQVTVTVNASCQCAVPQNNYTIRDTIPAGFTYVSSTGGSVSGNVVSFSGINFGTAQETKTYSLTLRATGAGCAVDTAINDNRNGSTVGGLTPSAVSGTTQWLQSAVRSKSPSGSWYAANGAATTDFILTSSAFTAKPLSVFSFWHYFVTENTLDGGRVEYSTDGGATWLDAGPFIVQNGYNATMVAASPWGLNQRTFSGASYGQGSNQFINTVVDFSRFSGQTVRLRLRMRTSASNASATTYEGWFVDDIMQLNGCGGMVKAGLYNSGGVRIDTAAFPLFVLPPGASLPVHLVLFEAKQMGREVLLNWQTRDEVAFKEFEVERSNDGTTWTALRTVDAKGQPVNDYTLYDQRPSAFNYYRVKLVDKDGRYKYSAVRTVAITDKDGLLVELIPNPARQQTVVHFSKALLSPRIAVIDVAGRTVQTVQLSGPVTSYRLLTGGLPQSSYVIRIQAGSAVLTERLVVAE